MLFPVMLINVILFLFQVSLQQILVGTTSATVITVSFRTILIKNLNLINCFDAICP